MKTSIAGVGAAARPSLAPRASLPAWPLVALVVAYPVEWALGVTAVASIAIAGLMAVLLAVRGGTRVVPGLLPLLALAGWVVACGIGLHTAAQAVGYLQRLGDLIAAAVAAVYYVNAHRVRSTVVVRALVVLWAAIVLLGLLAVVLPDVRLVTPMTRIVPLGLQGNDLVHQLLYPPLAEVQQPWGAARPFNRPAAPFPYANGWGAAFALLTPVVLSRLAARPPRLERLVLVALLVTSLVPAVQSSNRGMFLALALAVGTVIFRLARRGRPRIAVAAAVAAGFTATALVAAGAASGIAARQEVSDSTGTRADLYAATFRATLESPLLGWASPQEDVSIGYALGTQGAAWTYMYSYGFVGLALFVLFLVGAAIRTAAAPTTATLWLHAVLVIAVPLMWFYGLGTVQLIALALVAAVLLRARADREVLP